MKTSFFSSGLRASNSSSASSLPPAPRASQRFASASQAEIVVPSGEAFDRRRRGGGRGARGAEQMVRCQALPTVLPVGDQVSGQSRQFLIGRLLGRGGIDPARRGVPTRQFQRHDRPRIADHRVAHQVAQLVRVGRLARLARGHVSGAKFLLRLEDAGLQQRQQVVELDEIVLHRRGGEQQQKTLGQTVDQLVALAGAVAQVVGLVDDHQIERLCEQPVGMLAPARERERSDDPRRRPEALGVLAKQRVVRGHAGNIELGLQFLAPLSDQRGGDQHQHALDHAAQQIFLEHHACLDGLAEAHFVGEQHAAAKLFQYLAHGLGLVPEGLDAPQMRHAQAVRRSLRPSRGGRAAPARRTSRLRPRLDRSRRRASAAGSNSTTSGISTRICSKAGIAGAAGRGWDGAGAGVAGLGGGGIFERTGGGAGLTAGFRPRISVLRPMMASIDSASQRRRARPPGKADMA